MNRLLVLLSLFATFYFIFVVMAGAQTVTCQPVFGGGETCTPKGNVAIKKTIRNPQTNRFVDDLGVNDAKFQPNSIVTFNISVANISSSNINRIDVKDLFPPSLVFDKGPGAFDANTKNLTFRIDNLGPNTTRNFTATGRVLNSNQLPGTQEIVCAINQITASTNNEIASQDSTQFCIQRSALGAQAPGTTKGGLPLLTAPQLSTTPPTGTSFLSLLFLLPAVMAGLYFRKKSLNTKFDNTL